MTESLLIPSVIYFTLIVLIITASIAFSLRKNIQLARITNLKQLLISMILQTWHKKELAACKNYNSPSKTILSTQTNFLTIKIFKALKQTKLNYHQTTNQTNSTTFKTTKKLTMKKKILSMLSVCMLSAVLVNAQVPTSYRGAFDPSQPQWTDNWTNWDPNNTFYPATTVTKTGIIGSETWTKNNVYLLNGPVYVDSLATLTIEAGTVIRGNDLVFNSSLVVTRGAQIIANGTACNPIVFTSNKAIGTRAKADWGGVIILGRGLANGGTQNLIEGLEASNLDHYHGGTVANDNSGSFRYVRIEFGGYVLSPNNEINGLTMGSVGSGTTIDHVQVSFTNDDAFEWFGGSVNCNYLVSYRNLDDDFDPDLGYSGTVQFALGVKDPAIADNPTVSTSEGFESDNNATGSAATPKTSASFYNVTQIGAFRCGSNAGPITQPSANGFRNAARLRRNTELKIFNSIFMNNWRGLLIDASTIANGQANFQNNIVAMDFTTVWVAPYAGAALPATDAASTTFLNAPARTNTILTTPCDLLVNAWSFTNPDYRPNVSGSGGSVSGCDLFPFIEIDGVSFAANEAKDFLADVLENNVGSSNGTITVTIPKLSGWDITVPGLTLSGTFQSGSNTVSNVNGGTPNTNGDWNFRDDGSNIIAESKVGYTIPVAGFVQIGFTATRKGTTPNGTNQSLAHNVSGGSDNTPANNGVITTFSAN